jgi:hypothetical protein
MEGRNTCSTIVAHMATTAPVNRDLFLVTGVPGTGKTTFGNVLAREFGFQHFDFEDPATANRCVQDLDRFVDESLGLNHGIVVTWGFVPNHEYSVSIVRQLRAREFKLVWFDGNRQAALREFQKRGTVPDHLFHLQMSRVDESRIVERLRPAVIDPFDANERFKPSAALLEEIRRA